jgi:S1-C subfamily serine protease
MNRLPTYPTLLLALAVLSTIGKPAFAATKPAPLSASFSGVIADVQPKMVKIYGAGGFRGLEAYQSGFLISAQGHILTVWSYVLDTDYITIVLNDGRKFDAKLVGADPRLELAVLKVEAQNLPFFDLHQAAEARTGSRVLAFSNLYGVASGDEPASVQHGSVAVKTRLEARRGAYETPYRGPAYILDALTNNAGAAGGALTNRQGALLGMLGKELRNAQTNTWLSYAIPAQEMSKTADEIMAGKFVARSASDAQDKPKHHLALEPLGIVLVPDVLDRTPPYVDSVRPASPAEQAGLKPDDLVMFVNGRLTQSCKALAGELEYLDQADVVKLTVLRGQELVELKLRATEP